MTQPTGHIPQVMQECIAERTECHNICLTTVAPCLAVGGIRLRRGLRADGGRRRGHTPLRAGVPPLLSRRLPNPIA